jgi:hypothetical protein
MALLHKVEAEDEDDHLTQKGLHSIIISDILLEE